MMKMNPFTGKFDFTGEEGNDLQYKIYYTVGSSDADYITDGVADDVQIQAAIDAANTAGGGIVFIKAGTYATTTEVTLKSNVTVVGAGKGITVINSSVGTNNWCFDTNTTGQNKDDRVNIFVKDLTIASITPSHSAIIRNTSNCGFVRVEAYHTDWSAIRETLVIQHSLNVYFDETFIHDSSGNGVQVNACDWFYVTGNTVLGYYNNVAHSGTHHMDDGIDIDVDFLDSHIVPSRYGFVIGNNVDYSDNGNNIRIAASQHVVCSGNTVTNHSVTAAAAILVNGYSNSSFTHPICSDILVCDNVIVNAQDCGIKVQDSDSLTENIALRNNQLIDCGNSATSGQLGAGIILNAENVTVDDNFFDNCGKNSADGGALMLFKKNGCTMRWNTITNSPGAGFRAWNGDALQSYTGITLEGTKVSGNTTDYVTSAISSGYLRNNEGLNRDNLYAQGNVTGATTYNRVNGGTITSTLTGDITVTLTNGVNLGDVLTLILTQDGTGSRLVTWPSNFKRAGGVLTLSTTASAVDVVTMKWDGTNWREVSRAIQDISVTPLSVVTMADATSFTPTGASDVSKQTNTQAVGTLTANAPSGTPSDGQLLEIIIKSTNVQTFSWNAIYAGCTTVALPTATTGSSKTDKFIFQYNSVSSKWEILTSRFGYS